MQLHDFGFVNYAVLFGYLAAMLLVGVYFSKRQKTADDYFRAGGRVPGWAAGVSVFATTLSSILMNPLMILVKIIKLRWIHILSYDQMVSRKINNQTTRCANSIF
ncbi:hypothetical protein ABM006_16470, partial [Morganella morganii]